MNMSLLNRNNRKFLMLCKVNFLTIFFINTLQNFVLIVGGNDGENTHNVAKRMDLESYIGRFDVHEDTIIRTEESRSIGAKFLDNADVGSREECLRLCCETDGCDVFVFEEKSQGTCFLFQCGPPENFRCKFTHHSNYSSAVLTPSHQVVAPPRPPSPKQHTGVGLSQHEMELDNLREGKMYRRDPTTTTSTTTTTTLIPPLAIRMSDKFTTSSSLKPTSNQCSRFQFACHSGECIAVYNACDGIPQCVDGSDEGPECPSSYLAVATKSPSLNSPNSPAYTKNLNQEVETRLIQQDPSITRDMVPPPPQNNIQIPIQKPSNQNPHLVVQQMPRMYPEMNGASLPRNREDPMTAPQTIQHPQQQWQNTMQQSNVPQYIDSDSHIFNHKNGLQLSQSNLPSQYMNSMNDNNYQSPHDSYMMTGQDPYNNMINQQQWLPEHRLTNHLDWPQQQMLPQQEQDNTVIIHPQDTSTLQQSQHNLQEQQQVQQKLRHDWPARPVAPVVLQPEQIPSKTKPKVIASTPQKDSVSEESDENASDYEEEEIVKPTEPPKKKPKKHKKPVKEREHEKESKEIHKVPIEKSDSYKLMDRPMHEQLQMIKTDLEIEFADHDGPAERPGGAVLSLTLGVIVTAALAILVVCRMRSVGRRVRGRSGKSPYAHDADFLVNGMYL